jgi:hypothetical protein
MANMSIVHNAMWATTSAAQTEDDNEVLDGTPLFCLVSCGKHWLSILYK